MLTIQGIEKRFGDLRAVDGIDLEARGGEIFGLLGPNGAGKTTTLSMVSGLLLPDAGSITIDGISVIDRPRDAKKLLGVVPQDISLYEELSARENLRFWGRIYGLRGSALDDRIETLLERAGLREKAKSAVKTYSGGMKRRLHLLTGLIHSPRLLLLDEVTAGIDPQGRIAILDMVKEVAAGGTAVVYTSHYLEEVEELCDRVAIIDHGKILVNGTLRDLLLELGEGDIVSLSGTFTPDAIRSALASERDISLLAIDDGKALLSTTRHGSEVFSVLHRLFGGMPEVEEVAIRKPSLQSLFLKLTGRELRE